MIGTLANSQTSPVTEKIHEANKVKELVVLTLIKEGIITKEKGESFLENYTIIQHSKGVLGSFFDRCLRGSSDALYQIVKVIRF